MKRASLLLLLAVVLFLHSLGAQEAKHQTSPLPARPIRYVILVSVDGLLPGTYLSPEKYGLQVPTLREARRDGAWSDGVRSVLPTVTYAAHTSIATGTNPGVHGIVTNEAWDPLDKNDDGWWWYAEDIRVPTLWDAARARGLRTALIWWPVTVGARGTVVVPEIWRAGTADDVKLSRALSTPGVLEAVEKRFPDFRPGYTPPGAKDVSITDIAVHVIETVRPHLTLVHIFDVDDAQHDHGPFSPEALAAVENADRQVARLIAAAKKAGIWKQTALVVASDHGFAPAGQQVRPGVLLREKGLITLDERNRITEWKAVVVATSGSAYLYVKDADDQATRRTLLDTFVPLAGKEGSGIGHVLTQEEIRRRGGDPAAFLWIEGAAGFRMARGYHGEYLSRSSSVATHGFDPDRPDMQASLLIYGPAIAPGKIEAGRLIDIAPTMARWLGLKLERAEGRALPIRFRRQAR